MPEQSGASDLAFQRLQREGGLRPDADLGPFNTFGVPARANWLAEVRDPQQLPELMAACAEARGPCLVLGGGSNVLFTQDFPGLVLLLRMQGRHVEAGDDDCDRVRVAAGENWDTFVRWSLEQGYCGLENLILIPGSVGAAPIQNIGAYGVEVAAYIESVTVWDEAGADFRELPAADCGFAYRNSRFKREAGRFIVTAVTFRLPRRGPLRMDYAGIREELAALGVDRPVAADVARAVERLRRRKLPDPAETGNAGSFFQNPVVDSATADALRERFPDLPLFPHERGWKVSAAWMIEHCGFRGWRDGPAGMSEKHALVLVNHGGATGGQLWSVAGRVRAAVAERFGVELVPEPRVC